jgi:hypothetical protein
MQESIPETFRLRAFLLLFLEVIFHQDSWGKNSLNSVKNKPSTPKNQLNANRAYGFIFGARAHR